MALISKQTLHVDDVLCHLAARTNAPSTSGAQLDSLATQCEARTQGGGWTTHSKPTRPAPKDPDMARDSTMFRLLSNLSRIRAVDIDTAGTLIDVAKEHDQRVGVVVVRAIRAFQEALCAPTDEELDRARKRAEKATSARREEVFQRAIGEYRAPRAVEAVQRAFALKTTARAAELYGDCLLVLSLYVQHFNRA